MGEKENLIPVFCHLVGRVLWTKRERENAGKRWDEEEGTSLGGSGYISFLPRSAGCPVAGHLPPGAGGLVNLGQIDN